MALHPADSSPALKAHIKQSERLILNAYFDPVGVPTAGWGHTAGITNDMARAKVPVSQRQAEQWFEEDLDVAERTVRAKVSVALNQNQFDALVDFVFNCGAANFAGSTLIKRLNAGDYAAVPAQLMRWTKARNRATDQMVELQGLVIRRKWEADLWQDTKSLHPAAPPTPPAEYPPVIANQPTVIPCAEGEKPSLAGLIAQVIAAIIRAILGSRK